MYVFNLVPHPAAGLYLPIVVSIVLNSEPVPVCNAIDDYFRSLTKLQQDLRLELLRTAT